MKSKGSLLCSVVELNDSPMCPLRDDAEEMDHPHIQKCQNLIDTMDNISNQVRWRKYSKCYWNGIKKIGKFPLTGVG
jgi:hypothetical protein